MKMKQKWMALCLVAVMLIAMLCGCSTDFDITIGEDGSGSITETVMFEKEYLEGMEDQLSDKYVWEDVEQDGVAYKKGTKTISFRSLSDLAKEEEFESSGAVFTFDQNQFSMKGATASVGATSADSSLEEMKKMLQGSYEITFPYEVKRTNGIVQSDNKTVLWDTDQVYTNEALWAVFSDDMYDDSIAAPKLSGVKNNTYYKKSKVVTATSDTLITSLKVNNSSVGSDSCRIYEEGKYTVTCEAANGKTAKVSFVIDTTKPKVTGVANGKTYKSAKTIKFSDKYGVKSATLNGKKISSGKKVSKKGSYKLVVTDKAGNKNTLKFKIK
jgi:hypothetical protein